tara:strand:- start:30683 stop:31459 length:777 start_codon:yes stop_codon:yes gene_type:complete
MPDNAESHLEEVLSTVTADEEEAFEEHIKYRSQTNRINMKTESFLANEGGTEKMFDDVYHSAYKSASSKRLRGKTDDKSIADSLELVVIESLKKMPNHIETYLWKNFEAMKNSNGFESDNERLQHLVKLASDYLGATQRDVTALLSALRSGDKLLWNEGMRTFTTNLKDRIIDSYITKKGEDVSRDKEHKFKAYMIREMRDEQGVTPDNLAKELSPIVSYEATLRRTEGLPTDASSTEYAVRGLRMYEQKKTRERARR